MTLMNSTVKQTVDNFFGQYRQRQFKKGQVLILSGDSTDYAYHLIKGRVKQYDVSSNGEEMVLNVFKPPAFFPMSLAINGGNSAYIYETETDVALHQVLVAEVVDFLKSNPEVTLDLLSRVYHGLDGVLERTSHLMKSNARDRLMFEILINSQRFGEKNPDGSYTNQTSENELAARAGLSRETVSREMQKLVKNGLVSFKSGLLIIRNPKRFEAEFREKI